MYQPDPGNDPHSIAVRPAQSLQSLVDEIRDCVARQHAPVLLLLPEQPVQAFHKSKDFMTISRLKHEMDLDICFVIPASGSLLKWAKHSGFTVYSSQEEFLALRMKDLLPAEPSSLSSDALPAQASSSKAPSLSSLKDSSSRQEWEQSQSDAASQEEDEELRDNTISLKNDEEEFQDDILSLEDEEHQDDTVSLENDEEEEEVVQPSLEIPPLFSTFDFPGQEAESRKSSSSLFFEAEDNGEAVQREEGSPASAESAQQMKPQRDSFYSFENDSSMMWEPYSSAQKGSGQTVGTLQDSASLSTFPKDRFTTPIPLSFVPPGKGTQDESSIPLAPQSPDKPTPAPTLFKKRRWIGTALVALIALGTVLSVGVLQSLKKPTTPAATPTSVGYVYFQSSEPLNQTGDQGLNDTLLINLNHLATPAPGKSYHAWLLGDETSSDITAIYLGQINETNGSAHLIYTDPKQTNLLTTFSRFLVTEDNSQFVPSYPADQRTWRYEGTIPQTPDPNDTVHHYSILDHLRHLLATDPVLDQLGLKGGLSIWFAKNSTKLPEWTGSALDASTAGSTTSLRYQIISILDDLDGLNEVQTDVPAGTPFLVNRAQYRMGLLELDGGETDQPGLIYHMEQHLSSIDLIPGRTNEQHLLVLQIVNTLNNIQYWLQQIRLLAVQLLAINDSQLRSSQTHILLNNMATDASNAIYGTMDVVTGNMQPGAMWIYATMQRLATISVARL